MKRGERRQRKKGRQKVENEEILYKKEQQCYNFYK